MDGDRAKKAKHVPGEWIGNKRKMQLSIKSQEFHQLLFHSAGYLMVPKVFFKLMTADEALVLASLYELLEQTGELRKGWFFCTAARHENGIGFKRDKQDRIIKALIAKKFIKMERRGTNGKRHFLVRRRVIGKAIDAHFALVD